MFNMVLSNSVYSYRIPFPGVPLHSCASRGAPRCCTLFPLLWKIPRRLPRRPSCWETRRCPASTRSCSRSSPACWKRSAPWFSSEYEVEPRMRARTMASSDPSHRHQQYRRPRQVIDISKQRKRGRTRTGRRKGAGGYSPTVCS